MMKLRHRLRGLARNSASNEGRLFTHSTYGVDTLTGMRRAVVLLAVVLLSSCGDGASSVSTNNECPPVDVADQTEITQVRAEMLLGFSEADAERCATELGWAFRVAERDGESFALTMDYSPQRVNVVVSVDEVTSISVG